MLKVLYAALVAILLLSAFPTLAASKATTGASQSGLVDINTASASELDALPGIGGTRAAAIIAARPFASTKDLVTKGILSASAFAKIEMMVKVSARAAPTTTSASSGKTPGAGKHVEVSRIKACGAQWRADKAAGRIATGETWPQYWSECNARLKSQGQ